MHSAEERLRIREASFELKRARPELSLRQAHHLIEPLVRPHPRANAARLVALVGDAPAPETVRPAVWTIVEVAALTAAGWLAFGLWMLLLPSQFRFAYVISVVLAVGGGAAFEHRQPSWWLKSTLLPPVAVVYLVFAERSSAFGRRGGR